MRSLLSRMVDIVLALHKGFLTLLTLCDLGSYFIIHVTLCKVWLPARFGLELLRTDLPSDLKYQAFKAYSSYVRENFKLTGLFKYLDEVFRPISPQERRKASRLWVFRRIENATPT